MEQNEIKLEQSEAKGFLEILQELGIEDSDILKNI